MTTEERIANLEAVAIEPEAGVKLVRQCDAARAIGVDRNAVKYWHAKGYIRPIRYRVGRTDRRRGKLWVNGVAPNGSVTLYRLDELVERAKRCRVAKRWTHAEDDYLSENIGKISVEAAAEILGRSKASVEQRMCAVGITTRDNSGDYTASELARMLGVHPATVANWCNNCRLTSRRVGPFRMISPESVWSFLSRRPHIKHNIEVRRLNRLWKIVSPNSKRTAA